MLVEILSTGNEVLSGAVIDSNSAYLSEKLEEIGLRVSRLNCVGDDIFSITAILKEIGSRCDIAIVSGGLGPTEDDITAKAVAKAAKVKLVFDEAAFIQIKAILKKRLNKDISPSNKKQAKLPKNSLRLDNSVGTAPGFMMKIEDCVFFLTRRSI
mmetsp:Transcript_447/g.259  ORF Transcript_447/g.259 Transcript_447/m.259 type:complete len:155 (-) Transcript_447:912-1376(-)